MKTSDVRLRGERVRAVFAAVVWLSSLESLPANAVHPVPSALGAWDQEVVVPIVLSGEGLNGSFFTSELTLTNRGTTDATVDLTYTAAFGGGGGTARDTLAAGRQRTVASAIDYLASLGVPLPTSGSRGGTLRVRFTGLSAPSVGAATVRTTTAVAGGRAGLAYAALAPSSAVGPVTLCGLRQTATDRSNLALVNAGAATEGSVVLRVTVFSGDPSSTPRSKVLPDVTLAPGAFGQLDGVLASNGLALSNGYAQVERVSGTAPWTAYAVVNDQGSSDGSFVPPVLAAAGAGKSGITLPVAVEAGPYTTELVVTNLGAARSVTLTYVASAIQAPGNAASLTLALAPGEQRVVAGFVETLRARGVPGVGAAGQTFAGAVFLAASSGDVSGLVLGARTSSPGGGGRFGLFYPGVPYGSSATDTAWLYGLRQDGENRSNVAIVNTGEGDASASTFRVDLYDGETGVLAGSVPGITVPARGWTQLSSILSQAAPASRSAYARVTRTSGTNPFLSYAVVNDGGAPGQRSDDGAFVAMDLAGQGAGPRVRLERIFPGTDTVSFGLPLAPGTVSDTAAIRVSIGGVRVNDAHVKPLLRDHDANGEPTGLRAVLVQLPASLMPGPTLSVDVAFDGGGSLPPAYVVPFATLSRPSDETAPVVDRTIVKEGDVYRLKESNPRSVTIHAGREPAVIAHFPPGYLARSGFLGPQVSAEDVASDPGSGGLKFLSEALTPFVRSSYYEETYPLHPDGVAVFDPATNFEGWLYDRCATLLTASSHAGDPAMLRHALRTCSYYSSRITLDGANRGIFTGKADPDVKYSHLRGIYAYYALTGDEGALASGRAIADLWNTEPFTIGPYRQGHLRGVDKLFTERLLGTGLEGLYYGFRLTDDRAYLGAFEQVLDTAYRHVTTKEQSELVAINLDPNAPPFPPQNCFIHTALQHDEGDSSQPWCSGWMSELLIDSLLFYQAQTADPRVDEIFVRLGRFLRDVGSSYFQGNPLPDSFLAPSVCYDVSRGQDTRMLIPLYGSGLFAGGTRGNYGQYDDTEHCTDATALTAAALRGLARQGKLDQGGPIGPFPTEGASLVQLQNEFAFCSMMTFTYWTRTRRDPAVWTSADLAPGAADPAAFILQNKIGFPSHPSTPLRKLSWWFNTSMLQFGLLRDAGVQVPVLSPGAVQPSGQTCPPR